MALNSFHKPPSPEEGLEQAAHNFKSSFVAYIGEYLKGVSEDETLAKVMDARQEVAQTILERLDKTSPEVLGQPTALVNTALKSLVFVEWNILLDKFLVVPSGQALDHYFPADRAKQKPAASNYVKNQWDQENPNRIFLVSSLEDQATSADPFTTVYDVMAQATSITTATFTDDLVEYSHLAALDAHASG
jgi:hypothetical protein